MTPFASAEVTSVPAQVTSPPDWSTARCAMFQEEQLLPHQDMYENDSMLGDSVSDEDDEDVR